MRNRKGPSFCVTPAGTSTSLASRINGMTICRSCSMINVLLQFPLRPYLNFPCVASHQFISTTMNLTYIPFLFFFFLNLTYSRWTSSLPSCLWTLRIFPSLPGSRLTIFYRDASSALLHFVNQWLTNISKVYQVFNFSNHITTTVVQNS